LIFLIKFAFLSIFNLFHVEAQRAALVHKVYSNYHQRYALCRRHPVCMEDRCSYRTVMRSTILLLFL